MFAPTEQSCAHNIASLAAGEPPVAKAGSYSPFQAFASGGCPSGPHVSTPSLQPLLRQRSSSCVHLSISNGHTVLSAGGLTTSLFTTNVARKASDVAHRSPTQHSSLAGRSILLVEHAQAGPMERTALFSLGYFSESGVALMQQPKPQPATQARTWSAEGFPISAPIREESSSMGQPAFVPAEAEPDSPRKGTLAATAGLADEEDRDLLQPSCDRWLPMDAAWQGAGRGAEVSRPFGCELMPASVGSRLGLFLGDTSEDEDGYTKKGRANSPSDDVDKGAGCGPQMQGARVQVAAARGRRPNCHRACESGYTNSAPVDAAAAVKNIGINPAVTVRHAIAVGALSAPTAAPSKPTTCTTAVLSAMVAATTTHPWPQTDCQTTEMSTPKELMRQAGVDSASNRSAIMALRPTVRRPSSAARSARRALLNTNTPPGAAWPAASSAASQSAVVPWAGSAVTDMYERRSMGSSNFFGTALAVGLSSLLDTIVTEGPSTPKPQQLRGRSPTRRWDSAWARIRRGAGTLGSRFFLGCFTGSAPMPRG